MIFFDIALNLTKNCGKRMTFYHEARKIFKKIKNFFKIF